MIDPNKYKFKKCVLKFYDPIYKDNIISAENILDELRNHSSISFFHSWKDYEPVLVHIHFNIILRSTSYKQLLEKFTNSGPAKDPRCYLYMKDIEDTPAFIAFIEYSSFRERTNWYRYTENQRLIMDTEDTCSALSSTSYT